MLVYSAYVAEVYRAGIDSVHPSQEAAARSLGLSQPRRCRFVILPQAVRRVIPPLLNDFIGLQKDTALVGTARPDRGVSPVADRRRTRPSTTRPTSAAALLFVLLTIPLARLTDWLIARDRRRQLAGGVSANGEALRVEGVRKSFGEDEVLRGIDLEVGEHEVVCLIGASGSGKSTLLRCVNLLEPVDAGRIFLGGEEITRAGRPTSTTCGGGSGSSSSPSTSSRT